MTIFTNKFVFYAFSVSIPLAISDYCVPPYQTKVQKFICGDAIKIFEGVTLYGYTNSFIKENILTPFNPTAHTMKVLSFSLTKIAVSELLIAKQYVVDSFLYHAGYATGLMLNLTEILRTPIKESHNAVCKLIPGGLGDTVDNIACNIISEAVTADILELNLHASLIDSAFIGGVKGTMQTLRDVMGNEDGSIYYLTDTIETIVGNLYKEFMYDNQ